MKNIGAIFFSEFQQLNLVLKIGLEKEKWRHKKQLRKAIICNLVPRRHCSFIKRNLMNQ